MEDFAVEGIWWHPETPDRGVAGTLTVDQSGLHLVTYGGLEELRAVVRGPMLQTFGCIHGRGRDGELVTLFRLEGFNYPPLEDEAQRFSVRFAVVGDQLRSDLVSDIEFSFDHLLGWAEPAGFVTHLPDSREALDMGQEVLGDATVDADRVALLAQAQGSVGDAGVDVQPTSWFSVRCAEPTPIDDLVSSRVRPLQDLLTVLVGSSVRVTWLRVRPHDSAGPGSLLQVLTALHQVEDGQPLSTSALNSFTTRALFLRRELDDLVGFEPFVKAWFEQRARMRRTVVALLATDYTSFIYNEHRFTTAFQAAETLANTLFSAHELAKKEHRARVEAVVHAARDAGVDEEVLGWAQRVLQSKNDRPLKELIGEVVRDGGRAGEALLAVDPDFGRTVASTRGPLAHSGSGSSTASVARYWYSVALRWLVRGHLLVTLGVDSEQVWDRIHKREQFQRVCREIAAARASS